MNGDVTLAACVEFEFAIKVEEVGAQILDGKFAVGLELRKLRCRRVVRRASRL